ncbi:MAG: outer membrane protein [Candidatus Berkiella sp.]
MRMKSVLALSVLSASVFASTLGQASTCSNFLLGGELGWARQKEGYNLQFVAPGVIPAITVYNFPARSVMITDQGTIVGLLAGWQVRYDRWLAGIEANVDFQEFEETRQFAFTDNITGLHGVAGSVLYERGPVWALTLRGGYFVTPGFMPYVRVGAQYSRDEATVQENITLGAAALPDFNSKREHLWGAVAGIGVEFPAFIGPSTVRFEYTYAVTENLVIDDGALPIVGTHNFTHPHPETSAIKFAWVWNFA